MKNTLSNEELVELFARSVIRYYEQRDIGIVSDDDYDKFIDARNELKRRGENELLRLAPYLEDARLPVRFEAAWALSDILRDRALDVFAELGKGTGTVAFSALNAIDAIRGTSRFEGPPSLEF